MTEYMDRDMMEQVVLEEIKESGGVEKTLIDIAWSHWQLLQEVKEIAQHLSCFREKGK